MHACMHFTATQLNDSSLDLWPLNNNNNNQIHSELAKTILVSCSYSTQFVSRSLSTMLVSSAFRLPAHSLSSHARSPLSQLC